MTAEEDILRQCAAIVFAADAHGSQTLVRTALQLDFAHADDYTRLTTFPPELFAFYLVHGSMPDAAKMRLLRSIRSSDEEKRKYAPVVCILPSGPRHLIVPLVEMGFDEVLFMTDPPASMAQKLRAQLREELLFVETKNYFGPDRRRIEVVDRGDPRRRASGSPEKFRQIKVRREPATGISASYIS